MAPSASKPHLAGLLLTPGAGTGADHPGLVAIDTAVSEEIATMRVVRMDFPYRLAGRRVPDRSPVLLEAVRRGVADLRALLPKGAPVVIGGRSMGGRMCSMAIADGLDAAGLICVSYPLHPPGRPDKLRVSHLPAVHLPSLFISGANDAFGSPDELRHHLGALGGPYDLSLIEGVGHDLKRCETYVAALVVTWLTNLLMVV